MPAYPIPRSLYVDLSRWIVWMQDVEARGLRIKTLFLSRDDYGRLHEATDSYGMMFVRGIPVLIRGQLHYGPR